MNLNIGESVYRGRAEDFIWGKKKKKTAQPLNVEGRILERGD